MTQAVRIKKYENRRLYDTSASRYVNLQDVARLVRDGREVEVVDARSGEVITRQVLTQIIVESAKDPDVGPPLEFLRDLVRAGDRAQQDFFHWYLGAAQELYDRLQETWQESSAGERAPWRSWSQLWDPRRAAQSLLELWSPPFARETAPKKKEAAAEVKESDPKQEILELRRRLEDLERRLEKE